MKNTLKKIMSNRNANSLVVSFVTAVLIDLAAYLSDLESFKAITLSLLALIILRSLNRLAVDYLTGHA